MNLASTTLCVFTPADHGSATSSISKLFAQITTGTSTAATLVFATSTSPYSTSSVPFSAATTVASGAKADLVWLPAVGWNGNATIIAPADYVLLKTEGVGLGGYTYVGTCTAKFDGF